MDLAHTPVSTSRTFPYKVFVIIVGIAILLGVYFSISNERERSSGSLANPIDETFKSALPISQYYDQLPDTFGQLAVLAQDGDTLFITQQEDDTFTIALSSSAIGSDWESFYTGSLTQEQRSFGQRIEVAGLNGFELILTWVDAVDQIETCEQLWQKERTYVSLSLDGDRDIENQFFTSSWVDQARDYCDQQLTQE